MGDNPLEDSIFPIISHVVHCRVRCLFEYCPLCLSRSLSARPENGRDGHFATGPLRSDPVFFS